MKNKNFILGVIVSFFLGVAFTILVGRYVTENMIEKANDELIMKIENYNHNERINNLGE